MASFRLSEWGYGEAHPDRYVVVRTEHGPRLRSWDVWRGTTSLHSFGTHAEAIAWAQQEATLDALLDSQKPRR